MKLVLEAEERIRLDAAPGGLEIEAGAEGVHLSPFHLLAASLATCTLSVLVTWANTVALDVDDLALVVVWSFAEDPLRVASMRLDYRWPSLPEGRRAAVDRAATLCTVHTTLERGLHLEVGRLD
jgi:uncharacterized OsmC-like protein